MYLQKTFLDKLAKQGFPKSDVRFLGVEMQLSKNIGQISISEFSKKHKINSGSISAMLKGKRAIPLTLLKEIPVNFRCILKGSNTPIIIPNKLTENLAYLVGLLRDGTITKEKNGEYSCAFYSKNKKFLEKISPLIEKIFGINTKISKFGDCYGIRIRSKTLYLFFKTVFEFQSPQEKWNTPKIIENADTKNKRAYISGFFDAEGGVPHLEHTKNPKRKNMYVKFVQKNKESLEFIKNHLDSMNIKTGSVYWSENKYNLKISISSIKSFLSYIKSLHPEKANRLVMLTRLLSAL